MSLEDFVILDKLGQGSYATVFKAQRKTDGKVYALKQIKMNRLDEKSKNNSLNEVRLLASFDSPAIVTYHEAFIEESQGLLCIVMEYADKGDLMGRIKSMGKKRASFPEIQVWKLLLNLLEGTQYLHKRSILHRDIKPENIFICDATYKLGDLNISRLKCEGINLTQTGTPYYASPEVWNNLPYDEKTDIWSIGCALYEMAAQRPPFVSQDMHSLFLKVTSSQQKPIPKFYSNELAAIIGRCLQKDPKLRPSLEELFDNQTVKVYKNLCPMPAEQESNESRKLELLRTIRFPHGRQIKQIKFPKANYEKNGEAGKPSHEIRVQPAKPDSNKENNELHGLIPIVAVKPPRTCAIDDAQGSAGQHSTPKSETRAKVRSCPRTELSRSKRKEVISDKSLMEKVMDKQVKPFLPGTVNKQFESLVDKKLIKGTNKSQLIEQILKAQLRALEKGPKNRQGIFSQNPCLQKRMANVFSAVRL